MPDVLAEPLVVALEDPLGEIRPDVRAVAVDIIRELAGAGVPCILAPLLIPTRSLLGLGVATQVGSLSGGLVPWLVDDVLGGMERGALGLADVRGVLGVDVVLELAGRVLRAGSDTRRLDRVVRERIAGLADLA